MHFQYRIDVKIITDNLYSVMIKTILKLILVSIIVITCMFKIQNTDLVTDKNRALQSAVENGFQKYLVAKFNDLILTKND